ncbi:unnamed protein product [Symbiodinium microadriaticum]|nr:unnamed protein product [Symbiodinium microadriaticum]
MWCRSLAFLAALAALGRADPSPEDLSALLDDCADGSCALGLSQLRGELRQEVNATRQLSEGETEAWSEGGPVKCLCKDSAEMYFCAGSFEGLSKCYAPCPDLCGQKGGRYFMCGGGHEVLWLDRYFKDEERHNARCPKSKKK